ncbi:hypothetical protein [Halomonas sp. NO4]|uniref:hypothetical protein n=1 Tax=Halomonas sp. NO4 TaxID=2484813 RepID=UPI0013D3F397|nr:hypothetical protein [Halomonas sp. NO4]
MIRRVYESLTGVLGRDCQGRPLRQGDWVEVIDDGTVRPKLIGHRDRVAGRAKVASRALGHGPAVWLDGGLRGRTHSMMKLDDTRGSWDRVADLTAWTPREVRVPAEAPAKARS